MPTTTVQELMSPIVETLSVGDTLATARRQIERGRIRHLPVIDGDEHVARDVPIEMLMEKNVRTVTPETPAAEAAAILESHKYGCLPVVAGHKLVGIVTEADFVRFARRYFEWEARSGV